MKTLIVQIAIATVAATAALTAAPEARAASDFLLEIDGVKGESSQDKVKMTDFHWSLALAGDRFDPFQPAYAGGVSVAVGDLTGDGRWDNLTLHVRGTGDGDQPFFQYVMPGAQSVLTDSPTASHDHKEWILIESMSSPILRYRPLRPDGLRGDPLVGTWDSSGRFVGDIGVFAAFEELGAVRWADGSLSISTPVPEPETWALWLLGAAVVAQRLRCTKART